MTPIRPAYAIPSVERQDTPPVQPVSGSVVVEGDVNATVDFPAVQTVAGAVTVDNLADFTVDVEFPDSFTVDGPVTVANPTPPTDVSALATEATVDTIRDNTGNRYSGGKTPVVATVTASGDTTIYSPASGNAIRLFWITAINDPDESTNPLIKISLGALECYRVFAVGHWEIFEGEADDDLVVNLSSAASVAVTAHIQEFTP